MVATKVYTGRVRSEGKEVKKEWCRNQHLPSVLLAAPASEERQRQSLCPMAGEKHQKLRGSKERPWLGKNQCVYCKEEGHWAKGCPRKAARGSTKVQWDIDTIRGDGVWLPPPAQGNPKSGGETS